MRSDLVVALKTRPLVTYYVLALGLTWIIEIPLALVKQGIVQFHLPFSIHYLASYGPLVAAVVTTALTDGSKGVKELFGRMFNYRVHPLWWFVAFSPLILFAAAAAVLRVVRGEWVDPRMLGVVDFLPNLGVGAILLWILTYGLGEESGWRGFLLPRLQKNRSAFSATVILWALWAFWHAPAFFYVYDPKIILGFLMGLLAGAIVFTWLYNGSGGSILIAILFHGVFNFTTAAREAKTGLVAAIVSTIVIIWAVVVVAAFKPATLCHREKQVM